MTGNFSCAKLVKKYDFLLMEHWKLCLRNEAERLGIERDVIVVLGEKSEQQ